MATHDGRWPAGSPCWVEITVGDLERSQAFYAAVLGWAFEDSGPDYGHYRNALVAGRRVAGMSPPLEGVEDWPKVWTTYLATDDVEVTAERASAAGAQVVMEPMDIAAFGRVGLWVDPGGAAFGGWEALEHNGFGIHDEHGAVSWVDLVTPDLRAAKTFYRSVFGLSFEDLSVPGIGYATFTPAGAAWPAGGVGDQVDGDVAGPRWCVTFAVDDVDAAVQRVLDAGGSAPNDPVDTESGRIATVAGPDGEEFSLMTPSGGADLSEPG
ncbi:VOC family protein [Knoellia flava]|uniref:VOC domain-containing protein n=1 Tax=Knoellia flava TaxID=913969 RepID=A0A8H9FTA8_9MICO|nr:VOC family protein [Knoellia flava]GGB78046.1 hypothetical protein GCM10011314_17130 [Knoellia flava]